MARRLTLALVAPAAAVSLWQLTVPARTAQGRPATAVEMELVLPALAATTRPGLRSFAEPVRSLLEKAAGATPHFHTDPPGASIGEKRLPLPPELPAAIDRMRALCDSLRTSADVDGQALLQEPEVGQELRLLYRAMGEQSVREKGVEYRVSRFGVVLGERGARRIVLAPEPVLEAVAEMNAARARFPDAVSVYRRHETLWRTADERSLFPNLIERDAQRNYDDQKRQAHLALVLEALIPNLVETVTIDLAGLLELVKDRPLEGRPVAVVALRHDGDLNRMVAGEDEFFARQVAPVHVVVMREGAPARVMLAAGGHGRSGPKTWTLP